MIGQLSKNCKWWLLLSTYLRTWKIVPNVHHSLQNRCSVWTPSKNSLSSCGNVWWCFVANWGWRRNICLQFKDWPNNTTKVCFDEVPFWFLLPQLLRLKWRKPKMLVKLIWQLLFCRDFVSMRADFKSCMYEAVRVPLSSLAAVLIKKRHVSITVMWQSDEQGKWQIKNLSLSSVNKIGSPPGCWMPPCNNKVSVKSNTSISTKWKS